MYTEDGRRIPVTKIQAGPCFVTGHITTEAYQAVQLGFSEKKNVRKSQIGHLKKAGLESKKLRFFREVRIDAISEDLKLGTEIHASDVFKAGDSVRVVGVSKGKGFAGVVKRHHFKGGPRSHGQSDRERSPGSIGMTTTPGRVFKGKRMAGRMGSDRITVEGLKVIAIESDNTLIVKGLVPGAQNGLLIVEKE